MLRIAIIGIGHQGRNHARSLQNLNGVKITLIVDKNPERCREAAQEYAVETSLTYRDHLPKFDAAIIAVPTVDHFSIASDLVDAGKHLLIEKPVTATVEEAERLASLVQHKGTVAHVGFPERFNPAVEQAMPEITRPLFVETHRLGIFSPRSLDIDVVLDLMIHDLDLLHCFLKEEPSSVEAVGIPILSRNIDIANARLKFPGKCVANLTASRVSAQKMRKMRLFQPYSYLSLDFAQQSFTMFSLQPNLCNAGFPEIRQQEFQPKEATYPLERELIAFRDAIAGVSTNGVTIGEAIHSLKIALAVKQSFLNVL